LLALKTFSAPAPLADVPGLPPFSLETQRLGFVGIDVGGEVGLLLTNMEPRADAGLFALTGGGHAEWLIQSAATQGYASRLFEAFGVRAEEVDYENDPPAFWPILSLWQTLSDPGDALAFAPSIRRKPRDFLIVMARDDEVVSNRSTETLARALRLPIAGAGESRFVSLEKVSTPVAQNVAIAGELSTQALFEHTGTTHTLYAQDQGSRDFVSTNSPPFVLREPATSVDNPIESALTQAVFFFESWRNGSAQIIDPALQLRRSSN
jgi:hypothetical protein